MRQITRRALGLSAAAAAAAARPIAAHAAGTAAGAPRFDPLPYVHPELRRYVPMMLKMDATPLTAATLPAVRKRALTFMMPVLPQPAWTARTIPGPAGAPDVRLYVVNAGAPGVGRPAILHVHGGGYVLGAARPDVRRLQEISAALGAVIVSVDYRLAPETPFPGPLEDGYAGLKWLSANAEQLGADPKRIAVMGESAGGGLAAMLAIAARDRGEIPLAYQALVYPMLDDRTGSTRRKPPYQGALVWTPAQNRFGWSSLLGVPAGSARVPYGAVPARVEDLRSLPPAFIGVGSIDLFVDEDIDYARRLLDAGVPVTLEVTPGGFHGFDGIPGTQLAAQFRTALLTALAQGLQAKS